MKINQADIENHILIREEPNKDDENATFVTMNGKVILITCNRQMYVICMTQSLLKVQNVYVYT